VRKPVDLVYGVAERPPPGVTLLSAVQQAGLISIMLVYPVLVGREAGAPPETILDILRMGMVVIGVGTILQALPAGSGYLCPPIATAIYLVPSLQAARSGGLPLVFGMTVIAGLLEVVLSRGVRLLRPLVPPELTGFVVTLIAVTTGSVGIRYLLDVGGAAGSQPVDLLVGAASLATMVALNVWTTGAPRLFCMLIGMAVGYVTAAALGRLTPTELGALASAPLAAVPRLGHVSWAFDPGMMVPFGIAAVAATLKTIGNVTTCQKMNDADWTRPDFRSISGGVLIDGVGSVGAGLLGTVGVNTSSGSVGLASASGVASRAVAHAVGGLFVLLAFVPKAGAALAIMPKAVMGAALLFSAAFFFVSGLQLVTSRMLDARKTIVIGLSFMVGLAVDLYPSFFETLRPGARPFVSSSLVLGTLTALVLNLAFRLGVRSRRRLMVDPKAWQAVEVEDFLEVQGAAWGARRDVIERASFSLTQSIESIVDGCAPEGPLEIEASFDEFNLDLRVSYAGPPLEFPDRRPSNEEIMASDEGQRKLAGFLLRRQADRVQATHRGGRSAILLHFDH
jgi:NCS2 family nucleobase:cation symporter-2